MNESEPPRTSLTDVDLSVYLKRRIVTGLTALGLALVAIVVAGVYFDEQIKYAAEWTVDIVGVPGILAITTIGDMFVTPFPPDVFLVVIAESELSEHWYWVVIAMGLGSSLAGNVGWWLGKKLGMTRVPRLLMSRMKPEDRAFVSRYGRWGVAVGALTPVPFSLTCWMSGMLKLKFSDIWMVTLLRVPRFVIYYILIHYSAALSGWLG